MAAIDKIYLNKVQYNQMLEWINKQAVTSCGHKSILRSSCSVTGSKNPYAICNFVADDDKFLAINCRLSFIQKRLIEQYGSIENVFRL